MSTTVKKSEPKTSSFVLRAERAFQRAAKTVRAEYRRHGITPLVWKANSKAKAKA
jgi:hypothetical protein